MGVTTLGGLNQLVDDVLRRWLIRVTHAEINNILTTCPRRRLQLIDNIKNIRGQPLDAGKFFYHTGYHLYR